MFNKQIKGWIGKTSKLTFKRGDTEVSVSKDSEDEVTENVEVVKEISEKAVIVATSKIWWLYFLMPV